MAARRNAKFLVKSALQVVLLVILVGCLLSVAWVRAEDSHEAAKSSQHAEEGKESHDHHGHGHHHGHEHGGASHDDAPAEFDEAKWAQIVGKLHEAFPDVATSEWDILGMFEDAVEYWQEILTLSTEQLQQVRDRVLEHVTEAKKIIHQQSSGQQDNATEDAAHGDAHQQKTAGHDEKESSGTTDWAKLAQKYAELAKHNVLKYGKLGWEESLRLGQIGWQHAQFYGKIGFEYLQNLAQLGMDKLMKLKDQAQDTAASKSSAPADGSSSGSSSPKSSRGQPASEATEEREEL